MIALGAAGDLLIAVFKTHVMGTSLWPLGNKTILNTRAGADMKKQFLSSLVVLAA